MSEWIEHDGKGMPVDGDTLVYVRFADGWEDERDAFGNDLSPDKAKVWGSGPSSNWVWGEQRPIHLEIVAYRIVSQATQEA